MDFDFVDFVLWESNVRDAILIRRQYVTMAGGLKGGAVLGRIVYYYLPGKDGKPHKLRVKKKGDLWIAKSREDWQDETFLSKKEFDRALKDLIDRGLVAKKTFHFAGKPMLHVRLVIETFLDSLAAILDGQYGDAKTFFDDLRNRKSPKGKLPKGEKQEGSYYIYIDNNTQTESGENSGAEGDAEEKIVCPECGSTKVVTEKYDPQRRCAYCLLRAAWAYYFPDKPQPKLGTKSHRRKAESRWKDGNFRKLYRIGLERASQSPTCRNESWFNFAFFVANDQNYLKMQPEGFWIEWRDKKIGHAQPGSAASAANSARGQL